MNRVVASRMRHAAARAVGTLVGRLSPVGPVLADLAVKPARLGFEFTNLCNADCVFCPYQHQRRPHAFMSDEVFEKALGDYVAIGGGDVELTPVVGDSLIHPDFITRARRLRSFACVRHILLITNGILIDKHGVDELLGCGVSAIVISTAGFDKAMYQRVYRSPAYERMRRNVLALAERNAAMGRPVDLTITLRPDRPLDDVLADPDFQPILAHRPNIAANRVYSDAGGRISRADLPGAYRLRVLRPHKEACSYTFDGPVVLSNGTVMVCNCLAAMDAAGDLGLGNIMEHRLIDLWRSDRLRALRASFGTSALNPTCAGCTMYQNLDTFRRRDQRARAAQSRVDFERATGSSASLSAASGS